MLVWESLMLTLPLVSILFWFFVMFAALIHDFDTIGHYSLILCLLSVAIAIVAWITFLLVFLVDIGAFDQIHIWLVSEVTW